ncbi:putative acyl-CoA desaturase [Rosa chinensis]|uniref:Putative acyl-CoA desaturase n=1 Tax=Rosa chinensis TaxID=74649 RepID=A0A2P6RY08_ROSCH|nr:putative acyl-CoA desaturase [Rosa chinensis]
MAADELVRVLQWRAQCLGGRKWDGIDILSIVVLLAIHCLVLLALFHFNWSAFWVTVALYYVTGVGVTLSLHRKLAHRSVKLPKWLEYSFAYCAVLSLQGSPLEWVSTHRIHHQVSDTWSDPHSPIRGYWFSYIGWIFAYRSFSWYYRFLDYTYLFHSVTLAWSCTVCSRRITLSSLGTGCAASIYLHTTFSVNWVCHKWGKQVWDIGDQSRKLHLEKVGPANNHHAFQHSAQQGLEWWQIHIL